MRDDTQKNLTVLVADPDRFFTDNLARLISRYNHNVVKAYDGLDVIQILKDSDGDVDLIFINTILPKINGCDICLLIRKEEQRKIEVLKRQFEPSADSYCDVNVSCPIMKRIYILSVIEGEVQTREEQESMIKKSIDHGADDFIIKPFSLELFESKLKAAGRIIHLQDLIQESYKRIYKLSTTDILCDVWNRRTILTILKKMVCIAIRENKALGVFMIDVDHFKRVNDRYGHLFGDAVLHGVAQQIKGRCCRVYDELGRYGGEEFLLLTPIYTEAEKNMNDEEKRAFRTTSVEMIAKRVLEAVSQRTFESPKGETVSVTVSIGATLFEGNSVPVANGNNECGGSSNIEDVIADVIHKADTALYGAKKRGRNTYELNI